MGYTVGELDASSWDAFAELVERNGGIFGGCWCIGFHLSSRGQYADYRAAKEELVRTGRAHAALVFDEDDMVISAGNFHGQPLAMAADYAAIALAEMASISERRIEQMLNPALSGLPAFLAEQGGLHSGLMVSQYTAASLVSENKVLAHPASVDSIPTSANQEDHVSMGTHACRKARQVLENVRWVVAIELLSAAQALDFHLPLKPGRGVQAAYGRIRELAPHIEADRLLLPDLERVRIAVCDGSLVAAVEADVGPLA